MNGHIRNQPAKGLTASYKISFTIKLDQGANLGVVVDITGYEPFLGGSVGPLGHAGQALLAENIHSLVLVAAGFSQSLLAFHHGLISLGPQGLDHFCCDLGH